MRLSVRLVEFDVFVILEHYMAQIENKMFHVKHFIQNELNKTLAIWCVLLYHISMQEKLKTIFNSAGIALTDLQVNQFMEYYNLLIDYNKMFNLTAITEPVDVFVKHFVDSALPFKEIGEGANVIDVGTGAGFPLIPLKIMRPDLKITLVDAINKRVEFLNAVVTRLKFDDVKCIHSRAEDLAKNGDYREMYDVCVARAVAKLNTLAEITLPFVKLKGKLMAYKSDVESELLGAKRALAILGGKLDKILSFELPLGLGSRTVVVINKVAHSPIKYPRGQNKPKSNPL